MVREGSVIKENKMKDEEEKVLIYDLIRITFQEFGEKREELNGIDNLIEFKLDLVRRSIKSRLLEAGLKWETSNE